MVNFNMVFGPKFKPTVRACRPTVKACRPRSRSADCEGLLLSLSIAYQGRIKILEKGGHHLSKI